MFKFKRLDEIKLQLNEIERSILELVQLTRKQEQHIDYMYQDVLRKKINDAARKNEQEKRSPYINKIRKAAKGRKKQIKINQNKTYKAEQCSKWFGVTRQAICLRIRSLLARYIEEDKANEYFYKKNNSYESEGKKGKIWVITPKGLKLLARSYNVEVVE
jgi:hypothetical protein